jgi:5-methylcytosine-specific restriction enzyme subunit McrC
LKATLGRILETESLDRKRRASIRQARHLFDQVSNIELSARVFYQVRLHQNNRLYAFLINVCRFFFESLQPMEHAGEYRFQDVLREPERLRRVFEKFVRNFYRRNQTVFSIGIERMKWAGSGVGDADFGLVPEMVTDVSMRAGKRVIVIECKYTESIFQQNYFAGKFRSPHLYQLAAYLRNLGGEAEGILLYPTAGVMVDQTFELQNHRIRVATVDLNRGWPEISQSLLGLITSEMFR